MVAVAIVLAAFLSAVRPAAAPEQAPTSVTERPCFGAAARSPLARCVDPDLRLTVFPPPQEALLDPNATCDPIGRASLLYPCRFGAPGPWTRVTETVALVGDSHAAHWRSAVDVVARRKGWPAISITRTHCPFIAATVILPRDEQQTCQRWNEELLAWLGRHPEVRTLFASHRISAKFVTAPGTSNFETQVAGHRALWRKLPASVQNVVVIRDTPRNSLAMAACVARAVARGHESGAACARPRRKALQGDPAVVAARRMGSERVDVVDLSRFFCDRARCYPVVGGALVHKDQDHITSVFAKSLGRFLLRAFDQVVGADRGTMLDALRDDERADAECVIAERLLARQAGGWEWLGPEHLARAKQCRVTLEARATELRRLGLNGERNRAKRFEIIGRVLDVDG